MKTVLILVVSAALMLLGVILVGYPYPVVPTEVFSVDALYTVLGIILILAAGALATVRRGKDRNGVDND